jgi:MoxR-like ATPase
VAYGASPRGPIALVQAARALALVHGRDYVIPGDIRSLVKDAFRHRLVLTYQALAEEVTPDTILDTVLAAVPVPKIDLAPTGTA